MLVGKEANTMTNSQRENQLEQRGPLPAACHKCGKTANQTDVVECSNVYCSRVVCCGCATELEWELSSCTEHSLSAFTDLRDMYRNSLRRAANETRVIEYTDNRWLGVPDGPVTVTTRAVR